ncbi:substrate-binding domain-containing protein [Actinocatenispora rupis]|uniref:Molybdate/tungstate transport system substrate-binding protein n=1 Tax=Actinocatenispora rupis TaxID=519421 RepID=A0A8J3NES2_9ACTN|nr:substrate-binding domain-containing protein [Actinocatenispora rupis]GID16386.1 hypothetical protein Aru02nite_72750 [Actinocatenispora rupis]
MRLPRTVLALVAAFTLVTACSSGGGSTTSDATHHGTVTVLYAGSLVNLMEKTVGPGFDAKTGYTFRGEGKGSQALANEITGKVTRADVFVSASPKVNDSLKGWVTWYATFGSAPLVLGYNAKSRFAHDLKTKPWQQVVKEPGFRLGRTDPKLDPKGKLSVQALRQVGLGSMAQGTDGVYPEEALVGRLESGQLDAGFFYTSESTEAHLPTVGLGAVKLAATYTVTVLRKAPQPAGASAFVSYLLGPDGAAAMKAHGLTVQTPPTVTGDAGAVPSPVAATIRHG